MALNTASEGITFAKKLENDSANFYESLAQLYPGAAEAFLLFTSENRKNNIQIDRAYYGVISDAIEGCFAFNINPDDYILETAAPDGTDYTNALNQAEKMERKIIKFYSEAAEQSKSLMADVPRAFMTIAQKRENRLLKLESLLKSQG